MELTIKAIARSPICLSSSHVGFSSQSIDYIAGSALRGALAGAYLRAGGAANSRLFRDIFLSEQVLFPNLYPGGTNSAPIPLSARSCKRFPGAGDIQSEHGICDRLVELTLSEEQDITDKLRCPQCKSPLDRITGFYIRNGRLVETIKVKKRLMTHVGLSRVTGTAEEGFLYSLEVLEEGQYFSGRIICADNMAEQLRQMFEKYGNELYVGTARTRGLGCLSIKEVSDSNPTTFELKAFDQRYRAITKDSDSNSLYFTVTLLSDTILQDSFFRYQGVIKEENFKEFGINPGDIQLQDYMSDQVRIQGWNSAAGWPKEDEMAIRKGSVFLYRYRGETSALQRSLEKIQRNGIGARRAEGFGRVSINDPFHWEVER